MNVSAVIALGIGAAFVVAALGITGFNAVTQMNPDRRIAQETSPVPDDFYLRYSFNPGLAYTLTVDDTGRASYDVEMCHAILPTHATISVSRQEVDQIWKSIEENRIFEITEDFTKECPDFGSCRGINPADKIVLEVQARGTTKTIEFNQNYALNHSNEQLDRFNRAKSTIDGVLEGYEDLPRSDCRYA